MAQDILMDAPITAVTVFTDGARVTRAVSVGLEPGLRPGVIGGLPATAEPASVRVAVRGHDAALLEVEVHRRYGTDPLREETLRLRSEVERCRDEIALLGDEDTAEQARLGFAAHLSLAAAQAMARAVGFGRADNDDLAHMAGHLPATTPAPPPPPPPTNARKPLSERQTHA